MNPHWRVLLHYLLLANNTSPLPRERQRERDQYQLARHSIKTYQRWLPTLPKRKRPSWLLMVDSIVTIKPTEGVWEFMKFVTWNVVFLLSVISKIYFRFLPIPHTHMLGIPSLDLPGILSPSLSCPHVSLLRWRVTGSKFIVHVLLYLATSL